ncbi:phosphoenolpyruvate carboxylase, partial [Planoprotostelium fungivorum]
MSKKRGESFSMLQSIDESLVPDSYDFLSMGDILKPKPIASLTSLWSDMFPGAAKSSPTLKKKYELLLEQAKVAIDHTDETSLLDNIINDSSDDELLFIIRSLHLKIHLAEIDTHVPTDRSTRKAPDILDAQFILQSFLDYIKKEGPDNFENFVNQSFLRLVSTVHPNETERTTNLMHYTSIQEKYNVWKKDFDSLKSLQINASEYRIRREGLNTLRREIKAEIEGIWQSNQLRMGAIQVQNEARRILDRYKVIFKAYPTFLKFVKHLAGEAFWRYHAHRYSTSADWRKMYTKISHGPSREDTLAAIKQTFAALGVRLNPPKIVTPVIHFGTWKGGDRDGNPFVIASFSNQTFIEQKEFVLSQYTEMARTLVDKLTISTRYVSVTEDLRQSLLADQKLFPYINNIKPSEPYRAKVRYILEKLDNTLTRTREVLKQAGETVKPLLGLSQPGPTGYNSLSQLQSDVNTLYASLLANDSKAQARSMLQDFQILVDTFGLHMAAIDFRQTSEKNKTAVIEYLKAIEHEQAPSFQSFGEKERIKLLMELILTDDSELTPWTLGQLSKTSRDTFETLVIFADAATTDPKAVGKFIISMCQNASDILVVLLLMKLNGMLKSKGGKIVHCPFDVTGLFETIEDLKAAPRIVTELLSIQPIRNYITEHRNNKLTIMLGYSDSVRDGSSFASDSQIARTTIILKQLEAELNRGQAPVQFVFYRGRGDTLPRGFGGSVTKAMMSQMNTTSEEDHTEQNRYLR